jgi:hypothetical protein
LEGNDAHGGHQEVVLLKGGNGANGGSVLESPIEPSVC